MDCSTIIVSYNTFDLTRAAVEAALAAAGGLAHEVIVVDNHSPDDSAARLHAACAPTQHPPTEHPHVHILANTENTGFSKANNQGAARAQGTVLFFLNPDTLAHGQAIGVLYDFLTAHPEAGAVGPHVLNLDGTDQPSTSSFPSIWRILRHHLPVGSLLRGLDHRHDAIPSTTQPVDIVNGCALALRREVFDTVGGWDASYFMYAEEAELCYALRQAGYTNYFVRAAQITHYGGASTQDTYAAQQLVQQRSTLQFLRRHHSSWFVVWYRMTGVLGFGLRALLFPLLERLRPERASAYRRRGQAAAALFRWFLHPALTEKEKG